MVHGDDADAAPGDDGRALHFDAWYDRWKDYRATWLDRTLEQVAQDAESAVLDRARPHPDRTRLHELARMSFAAGPHEPPADRASRRVRNPDVHLTAMVWAEWAATGGTGAHCDGGPVAEILPTLRHAPDDPVPTPDGSLHRDPLVDVILYNPEALVVLDRDDGQITHLFSLVDGRPLCVSGTSTPIRAHVATDDPRPGSARTVTLRGRTLTIACTGVRPGHLVANEFCVDLWRAVVHGEQPVRAVTPGAGTVSLGGATVTVTPGPGCGFSDDTADHPTGRLDVVCPDGGDFSYRIDLP